MQPCVYISPFPYTLYLQLTCAPPSFFFFFLHLQQVSQDLHRADAKSLFVHDEEAYPALRLNWDSEKQTKPSRRNSWPRGGWFHGHGYSIGHE